MKQSEVSFVNGKVSYLCVTYLLFLFTTTTIWRELIQFGTITKHTWGWEIDWRYL